MSRTAKARVSKTDLVKDLWVNPRSNTRGTDRNAAWDNRQNITPNSCARFLELADIALGLKSPSPKRKKAYAAVAHQTTAKTEPYST